MLLPAATATRRHPTYKPYGFWMPPCHRYLLNDTHIFTTSNQQYYYYINILYIIDICGKIKLLSLIIILILMHHAVVILKPVNS